MNETTTEMIRTVDRIFEEVCTRDLREQAEAGSWPAPLWQALDGVGLTRAVLSEQDGGAGIEFEDAMAALRRTAYHAAPLPLAETMIAGRLLAAAGLAVPDGAITVAPVRSEDQLSLSASGPALTGKARRVPWGADCPHAVVVTGGAEPRVVLVRTDALARTVEKNLAGEPRVLLEFESTAVEACAPLAGAAERLELEGALCRSVQIAGALERILAYSLLYANERVQFGRPIGKFQAVQHMLAVLAGHAAAASAAANAAVEASRTEANPLAVAIAKARCGEAAGKGADIAHQVHAAMGYTREHNLHFSTRRLWAWRDEFGNEVRWQTWLGRFVAAKGGDALWPMLTAI